MARSAGLLITLSVVVLLLVALPREAAISMQPPKLEQNTHTEPLAIIVNRSNAVNDLTMVELRKLFLGGRSHWPNGRRVTLVMRAPGEPEYKTILRDVCQMDETGLRNHILHSLFTGEMLVSPKTLDTPAGVRKFVFNVPGAVGYLRLSEVDDTVKIVALDELLPEDGKYKLRVEVVPVN